MAERPRIVGLGQAVAGDDGVALVVVDELRKRRSQFTVGGSGDWELLAAPDPSRLVELLRYSGPVWIVDAVVGAGQPGQLIELSSELLSRDGACSVSSHGMDVRQAIELCQTLYPEELSDSVRIVGISIEPPREYSEGLTPAVAVAAERCVSWLLAQLTREEEPCMNPV